MLKRCAWCSTRLRRRGGTICGACASAQLAALPVPAPPPALVARQRAASPAAARPLARWRSTRDLVGVNAA
jgi:hypothetical protein